MRLAEVALVADSGIGRAVALAFAREGADVAISYLSEETDARETERHRHPCEQCRLPEDLRKIRGHSDEEFEEAYRVNVFAMFRLCKAILPQMKEGGSIVNTGSIQSFDPSASLIAYASTKSSHRQLTRSLASLAIKHGVRVNAVAPGPVWTPLIPSTMPKEKVKQFGSQTVFGRAAQPVEIAPIFVFLASDQASYVTGEVYGATGGQMPI